MKKKSFFSLLLLSVLLLSNSIFANDEEEQDVDDTSSASAEHLEQHTGTPDSLKNHNGDDAEKSMGQTPRTSENGGVSTNDAAPGAPKETQEITEPSPAASSSANVTSLGILPIGEAIKDQNESDSCCFWKAIAKVCCSCFSS